MSTNNLSNELGRRAEAKRLLDREARVAALAEKLLVAAYTDPEIGVSRELLRVVFHGAAMFVEEVEDRQLRLGGS